MSSVETPSLLFDEITTLFASVPSPREIFDFRPSGETKRRASELLDLNRQGRVDEQSLQELDHYQEAELLMRLVKARIRSGQNKGSSSM